jgi:cysteine-rich repeat protein
METADFYSPCVTNPEIIDLGPLPSDASALQDVSLFNAGTGNTPLVVHDIYVTNNSGYVGQFHLTIVRFVEDPANPGSFLEETIPDLSTNPYLLEVNDGEGAPELLLIHVRFEATAALEGQPVPPEFLVIQTDDASHPNYQIPFAGDVLCPAGWVELDGVSPWCEYACTVTNGGVEGCDGVDNNCDGAIDEGCPVCGNGVVEAGETCDDGNGDNTDACPDGVGGTCQPAVCGDGHVQAGVEECDDGNGSNADACPDDVANGGNCEDAVCGDGFVHAGVEGCDDGNHSNTDACPDGVFGSCLPATCGDGFLQAGVEECDEGTANSDTAPDACRRTCVWAHCGDNVVDTGEMCDDGNNVSGDGCSADCSSNEVCGNSVVDPGELCDDGNQTNSDACPDGPFGTCEPAVCGDGFVHAGVEDCEPPSVGSCDANCMNAATLDPAGCFDIFPGPSQYCTFGLVNYTFSCVNFAVFGGTNLSVTANSGGGQPCVMNGTVDALGNFTATCTLYGGCDEIYTISGSFTSNNEWSGTFSASFVGSCYNCTNQSWSVVGQRRTTCPCP